MTHWTDAYIGIPFKIKGRDHKGVDCWGLVCLIYEEVFNIELPSYIDEYEDIKDLHHIQKLYTIHSEKGVGWISILRGQEKKGDVFLMPFIGIRSHVTICVEPGLMIHITENINVTVEEYYTSLWSKRYSRTLIYRHPEVYEE